MKALDKSHLDAQLAALKVGSEANRADDVLAFYCVRCERRRPSTISLRVAYSHGVVRVVCAVCNAFVCNVAVAERAP